MIDKAALSDDYFRTLIDCMPVATWMTDSDGRCDYMNQLWLDITGARLEDVYGDGWLDFLHPDDREPARAAWRNCVERDIPYDIEYRLSSGGGYRWFLTRGRKVFDENGNFVRAIGGCTDITDQKLYAERLESAVNKRTSELSRSRDEAVKATRMKTEVLATVAHEVRTPMASVIGLVELLSKNCSGEEQLIASTALNSSKKLLQILNDLLDASRIESGAIRLDNRPFELRPMFTELSELLTFECKKKSLAFVAQISAGVPEMLFGDELRLRQILQNLIFNAVKFTKVGSVNFEISLVENTIDSASIRFDVTDTGIGIRPEQVSRIFEPYVQADEFIYKNFGGTGLGLSICKTLVELMGGTITVESQPGRGSKFGVLIPFKIEQTV